MSKNPMSRELSFVVQWDFDTHSLHYYDRENKIHKLFSCLLLYSELIWGKF